MIKLFLLFFFSWHFCGFSQFTDSIHHYINYTGTGNINKTDQGSSYLLNNSLRTSLRKKQVEANFTASYIYGKTNSIKTNSDFFSGADINLFSKDKRSYLWGLANYEESFSLKINRRFQGGVGLGYLLLNQKDLIVSVTDGLLYESSSLTEADKYGRKEYETLRNSFRIKFRWVIKEVVTLESSNFLQSSLSDKNDYIIKSATSAALRLNKWLNLTSAVSYNRLNLTGTENLLITYGLSMERYF